MNYKVEASIGLGKFKVDNFSYFPGLSGTQTNANYWTAFSQINAIMDKKKSQVGCAARFSYINYNNFSFYESNNASYRDRYENDWSLNIEPVAIYSIKIKQIKINLQGGISLPIKSDIIEKYKTNINTNEETLATNSVQTGGVANIIARVAIQHNFVLRKKK